MKALSPGTALITGASSGIGAIYADRMARRGHDLILVARNRARLEALAAGLVRDTGRSVQVIGADLSDNAGVATVEAVLRTDASLTVLVNNAGIGATASLAVSDIEIMDRMIRLNITALMRLTHAIVPAFLQRGRGAIINISSVVGIAPELLNSVYGGSKAFVLAFSLALRKELAGSPVRVHVVLPGATATAFWAAAGTPLEQLPSEIVMTSADLVDAALAGFDQGELVTIPALPDIADWEAYEAARRKLLPNLSRSAPARRYALPAARATGTK
ncbi:MAG: SDR family NAD(P)-dependent oxidoreductase [Terriglobales bacterium]